MKFNFEIPTEDLEYIKDNIEQIKKVFYRFSIIDEHFLVHDESLCEYEGGADMFTWKEVEFNMDDLHDFWSLAKFVQIGKRNKK